MSNQTRREVGLVLAGALLSMGIQEILKRRSRRRRSRSPKCKDTLASPETITSLEELREVLPSGPSGSTFEDAKKVIPYLDDQMMGFIARSPFLQLATATASGAPSVSPKGDEAGFVSVRKDARGGGAAIVVPDRPGNRLLFGLQNIVENPKVSVLFEIPGTNTTLRCGGTARISKDSELLREHEARRCPPKVVLVVEIDYAFFHCSKAYMRSGLWNPETWPENEYKVGFGRYFVPKGSTLEAQIDNGVDDHYTKVQKAIDGEGCEVEH